MAYRNQLDAQLNRVLSEVGVGALLPPTRARIKELANLIAEVEAGRHPNQTQTRAQPPIPESKCEDIVSKDDLIELDASTLNQITAWIWRHERHETFVAGAVAVELMHITGKRVSEDMAYRLLTDTGVYGIGRYVTMTEVPNQFKFEARAPTSAEDRLSLLFTDEEAEAWCDLYSTLPDDTSAEDLFKLARTPAVVDHIWNIAFRKQLVRGDSMSDAAYNVQQAMDRAAEHHIKTTGCVPVLQAMIANDNTGSITGCIKRNKDEYADEINATTRSMRHFICQYFDDEDHFWSLHAPDALDEVERVKRGGAAAGADESANYESEDDDEEYVSRDDESSEDDDEEEYVSSDDERSDE
jgi:hypothetical protein